MKRFLCIATTFLTTVFFAATFSMAARPTARAQLLAIGTGLLLFPLSLAAPAIVSRTHSRLHAWRWTGPLLIPLLFVLAAWSGGFLRTRLFYRDLPALEQVVHLVSTDSVPIHNGRVTLPVEYSDLADRVFAQRESGGVLQITFFVGGGFPVKHLAYLYRSDGRFSPELASNWPNRRERQKNWFEVSD